MISTGTEDLSDEQLWASYVAGSDPAYSKLVGRYGQLLFRYLFFSLGDIQQAVQGAGEVFCRIGRYRDRFEGFASFRSWLFAVATQMLVPAHISDDDGLMGLVEDIKRRKGEKAGINPEHRSLLQMNREVRQPFLLSVLVGLPAGEVGKCCRMQPSAAQKRIGRALRSLSGEESFGPPDSVPDAVRGLPAPELPEDFADLVSEGVFPADSASIAGSHGQLAIPDTGPTFCGKALIFASFIAIVLLAYLFLALLSGSRAETSSPSARISHLSGDVNAVAEGFFGADSEPAVKDGAAGLFDTYIYRIGTDGLLGGQNASARFFLDSNSDAGFPDSRTIHLLRGRVVAAVAEYSPAPARILAGNVVLTAPAGAVIEARLSGESLAVTCLYGFVQLHSRGGEERLELAAGRMAFAEGGEFLPPVRHVDLRGVYSFLQRFPVSCGERPVPVSLAPAMPVLSRPIEMPHGITPVKIDLKIHVEGSLIYLCGELLLENDGDLAQELILQAGRLFWPSDKVLASFAEPVRIEPRGSASMHVEILAEAMAVGEDMHFAVLPLRGRNGEEAEVSVELSGCPAVDFSVCMDGEAVGEGGCRRLLYGRHLQDRVKRPVFFAFKTPGKNLAGGFAFRRADKTGGRGFDLIAVRPWLSGDEEVGRTNRILIGLDIEGLDSEADVSYANMLVHELMERFTPNARVALVAFTDRVRVLSGMEVPFTEDVKRHMKSMLWQLSPGGKRLQDDLSHLAWIEDADAGRNSFTFYLTGPGCGAQFDEPAGSGHTRKVIVQIGAGSPREYFRRSGAFSGGAAYGADGELCPAQMAVRILGNLPWPAYRSVELGGGADGKGGRWKAVYSQGRTSNRPVVLLAVSDEDDAGGELAASAGGMDRRIELCELLRGEALRETVASDGFLDSVAELLE